MTWKAENKRRSSARRRKMILTCLATGPNSYQRLMTWKARNKRKKKKRRLRSARRKKRSKSS